MRLRYRELRLKIPSLHQGNDGASNGGVDWCGRTSAAMIYNYYEAARAGGMDNAGGTLAINQRDKAPYDLVRPDGTRIVEGYQLLGAIRRNKSGWHVVIVQTDKCAVETPRALYPVSERKGRSPTEAQIREILAGPLRALEGFNPALCYTGLSANAGMSRHIVVLSGYRIGPGGALWLHIDDPGSFFRRNGDGTMHKWGTANNVSPDENDPLLVQHEPETHDTRAGRSYWLKASRLFEPNDFSHDPNDLWCDHVDRPGLSVFYNEEPEPRSPCVVSTGAGARVPLDFGGPNALPREQLALAHASARTAGAPFPMGGNRVWHNGIHLVPEEGTKEVRSVAPGQIVFARFADPGPEATEDVGAVLVRHAVDFGTLRILDPRDDDLPDSITWLYSLSMHLGPASREVFMSRLDHGDKPKKRDYIPAPVRCELFGYDADGDRVAIPPTFEVEREIEEGQIFKLSGGRDKLDGIVATPGESNLAAWEDAPGTTLLAPQGAPLALFDELNAELIELDLKVGQGSDAAHEPVLSTTSDKRGRPELAELHKKKGTHWVATADAPGIQLDSQKCCVHDIEDAEAMVPRDDPQSGRGLFGGLFRGKQSVEAGSRQLGVAFFREDRVSITITPEDGPEHASEAWLELGDGPPQPMWFDDKYEQPAAEPGAEDGALLYPELIPCVSIVQEPSTVTPTLYLHNPLTGRTLPTSHTMTSDLVTYVGPLSVDETFQVIEGLKAGIHVHQSHTQACIHSTDEARFMAETPPKYWPLLTCLDTEMPVWARTKNEGDGRWFPDAAKVSTKRRTMSVREGPTFTKGRLRVWPALSVVAGLEKKQFKALGKELDEAHDGATGDTLRRLEQGHSRLLGAQLGGSYGWEVVGDALQIGADRTEPVSLFVEVLGKGAKRMFPDRAQISFDPDPASWPGLRVVSQFRSNGLHRALVEVVPAVDPKAWTDNQAEIDEWKQMHEFVEKVDKALGEGEVVDFAALEQGEALFDDERSPLAGWRYTGGEPIGVVGRLDEAHVGMHLEMFAGSNIIPADGPNGEWVEVKTDKKPATDGFATEVAGALIDKLGLGKLARNHGDDTGTIADAIVSDQPFPKRLWRGFCAAEEVHRELSRAIAVHQTEWAIDWEDVAEQNKLLRFVWDNVNRQTVGWWPQSTALDGLPDDNWYFYQPLRLLEWLTTGVDVRVETSTSESTELSFVLGGYEYDMATSDADEDGEVFRIRTLVGEVADDIAAEVVLGAGIATEHPQVFVKIARGEVASMWLCAPGVDGGVAAPSIRSRAAVPYNAAQDLSSLHDEDTTYLLADPSDTFAGDGTSRVTVIAEARYNVQMPLSVEFTVPDGFKYEAYTVLGAVASDPRSDASGKHTIALEPEVREQEEDPSTVMFRRVQVQIVVAPTNTVGVVGTMSVNFSGGDLLAPIDVEAELATREIGKDAKGRDVVALQQYLHNLRAGGRPCYHKDGGAALIDGAAQGGTARAIWRFVLQYGGRGTWDRETSEIKATTKPYPVDFERSAPAPESLDTMANDLYTTHGHPIVDAALIAELVRHFEMPAVLPAVDLSVKAPALPGELAELAEKMKAAGRSTLVPGELLGGNLNRVHVQASLAEPPVPGDPKTVTVAIVLGEGAPYTLVGEPTRTLAALTEQGVELLSNGIAATDSEACTLRIEAGKTKLGTLRLGGARDLLAQGGSAKSLDAVLVQQWLARWPRPGTKEGTAYYAGGIDGEWGGGSGKALKAFRDEQAPDADYPAVLEMLAAGPPAAAEPEPEQEAAQ